MPYITQAKRLRVNNLAGILARTISALPLREQDGTLNFVLTTVLKRVYPRKYYHLNRAMGMLESVKQELYRTHIAPYEDEKRLENGDVK